MYAQMYSSILQLPTSLFFAGFACLTSAKGDELPAACTSIMGSIISCMWSVYHWSMDNQETVYNHCGFFEIYYSILHHCFCVYTVYTLYSYHHQLQIAGFDDCE